jgi:GNAT superfamily N-acetyltransferase
MNSKKNDSQASIRNLQEEDLEKIVHKFTFPWSTSEATFVLWKNYFQEHQRHLRTVCIIEKQNEIVGYGNLLRSPEYPHFKNNNIPEINAIWIDEQSRRQNLGTMLIKHFEEMATDDGYQTIGIGVGLYQDYGPAQRLYQKLAYRFDGNGITYKCQPVIPGESYCVDDDLIIWLTKSLVPK